MPSVCHLSCRHQLPNVWFSESPAYRLLLVWLFGGAGREGLRLAGIGSFLKRHLPPDRQRPIMSVMFLLRQKKAYFYRAKNNESESIGNGRLRRSNVRSLYGCRSVASQDRHSPAQLPCVLGSGRSRLGSLDRIPRPRRFGTKAQLDQVGRL